MHTRQGVCGAVRRIVAAASMLHVQVSRSGQYHAVIESSLLANNRLDNGTVSREAYEDVEGRIGDPHGREIKTPTYLVDDGALPERKEVMRGRVGSRGAQVR